MTARASSLGAERRLERAASRILGASLLTLLACEGSEIGGLGHPAPILESLQPAVVARATAPAQIELVGLGFVDGVEARWDGTGRPTTFVDPTRVTVELTVQDLAADSGKIDVVNPGPGGGASSALSLTIAGPPPVISSLDPTQVDAVVTSSLDLQVQGSGFVVGPPSSRVFWDGIALVTTVINANELTAAVPDYLLRAGRTAAVVVRNPVALSGASQPAYFDVINPVPTATSISPLGLPSPTGGRLAVVGTGFVHNTSVRVGTSLLTPDSVSGTRLIVRVPPSAIPNAATVSVRVENPAPGGGVSGAIDMQVFEVPPVIHRTVPSRVFTGAPAFTLAIQGADFDDQASLTWNGAPRAITVVDPTRIEVAVSAADVAVSDTIEIVVSNPGAGSTASTTLYVLEGAAGTIVGQRGNGDLVRADLFGNVVTTTASVGHRIDAHPLGPRIVYDNGVIREVDPTVTPIVSRKVSSTATVGEEQWARYNADGSWIYFMGSVGGRWEIWRSPSGGGTDQRLLAHATESYGYPAPSHDGTRYSYSVGVQTNSTLWIRDLAGSAPVSLGVSGATSRWTPADDWIVYWTWNRELRAVRPNGTGDFALTSSSIQLTSSFDISADGTKIIAARFDNGEALLIDFPSGTVTPFPELGPVSSVAWYGP